MLLSFASTLLLWLGLPTKAAPLNSAPGVIHLPFYKSTSPLLLKRQEIESSIVNGWPVIAPYYFIEAGVGTPAQTITFVLDTGSSDTWIYGLGSCSKNKKDQAVPNCGGIFDASNSSTFQVVQDAPVFANEYVQSSVKGVFITDNLQINDVLIPALQMAMATNGTGSQVTGVMGIAFNTSEGDSARGYEYPTIVDTMYNQKLISKRAYSLYLDDLEAKTGSIIFGGIDTAKFYDNLTTFPTYTGAIATSSRLTAPLSLISITDLTAKKHTVLKQSEFYSSPVVLDSGTMQSLLPPQVYHEAVTYLKSKLNITVNTASNSVPCSLRHENATVNYFFQDPQHNVTAAISVPFSELTIPRDEFPRSTGFKKSTPEGMCTFGIAPTSEIDPIVTLGDTFLRSAYLVFDLDDLTVSMAQAKFGVTESNVVPI